MAIQFLILEGKPKYSKEVLLMDTLYIKRNLFAFCMKEEPYHSVIFSLRPNFLNLINSVPFTERSATHAQASFILCKRKQQVMLLVQKDLAMAACILQQFIVCHK